MSEKFRIGSITRCIGMKGEVIINPYTFDPDRFFQLHSVYLGPSEDKCKQYSVDNVRFHKDRPIVKFSTVESRSDAEKLVGHILFIDEEDVIELPEGILFIHDIIGMDVYTVNDIYIGKVKDVLQFPAQNVYVVSHDGKEIMIPAVDEFLEHIDKKMRTIRIKPIEGLLE
jgi:16S rRNA processing protein RimM